ncbi:MAG: hypothetical protein HOV80_30185 [Polyangiaceae bacterium]|nr:hypothetical protein [Polyangiaceae bacterium]
MKALHVALLALAGSAAGCHPPPSALANAKRVVVIVGPPAGSVQSYRRPYDPLLFEQLEAATCGTTCKGVAGPGERLTGCFRLPSESFATSTRVRSTGEDIIVEPTSLHVCTVE